MARNACVIVVYTTERKGLTMSHELDGTDNITFFADSRTDAWHQLGQQVGHLMTAEEVLAEAHLANWNVRKSALFTADEYGNMIQIEDKAATVRTNPISGDTDYLGVVGKNYRVIQNEESTAFLDALVDESGAHFETAGALRGGRSTFVTLKLPKYMEFTVPGTDRKDGMDLYLAALNSHDGSGAYKIITTPVRIVCANTESAALAQAKSTWSVRHTTNALNAIEEARQSLKVAFTYADAFAEEMQKLIDAEVDEQEAERLINSVFQVEEADTERQRNSRMDHAAAVMVGLNLPTVAGFENTKYGLYNAVTEYIDHRIEIKDGVIGAPAYRAIDGAYADIKSRAFQVLAGV